ncbi:DUF982 domain-containing protein [Neorhizobium sp. Rsf11]|uniref:DUF982 domain-containing protein n=1 Tax=Neorhizobium phenanthreniclasticum TaxID=3157917 RepID=A0ABV0M2Z8_9HYPH|nr:DUF982 domain-containing protein [Neorhizobium petrolearium]
MAGNLFDRPLFVKRKHFIQEIGCLDDIFDFLEDWPEEKRDITYETTLGACRDAVAGRFPPDVVRDNFERFLQKNGMLAEIEDIHSSGGASATATSAECRRWWRS